MKHSLLTFICFGLLIFGPCRSPGAMEIGFTGGINNMTYHPDRVSAHSTSPNITKFQEYNYGFGDLFVKGEISDNLGFIVNVTRDNILQNSITGKIITDSDYLNVEFGPLISICDNFDKPIIGITGGMQVAYPGIVFLAINGSSSIGTQYEFLGNHTRETAEVKIGFWLPNLIPSLSFNTKSFSRELEDLSVIRDELTRFQLSTDIFIKNFPLTLRIDGGYEILSRSYDREASYATDKLSAVYAGVEAKWQVTKPIRITAGFEMPVYVTADEPMETPDSIFSLFKAFAGVSFRFF